MSSMTIDQLKKSLTEQGITLPPARSKKADYIKLYKQYSTINDSLGDVYSSDDENPPRSGSQNVSSSSSPGKPESIAREVEQLSDDELYHRLKEFDDKIGPVLKNTRRVYERKLIKMLTSGKQTNGYEAQQQQNEKYTPAMDEFSDSDVEIVSKSPQKTEIKGRKSSVLRDSPKPSFPEPSRSERFSSNYSYSNRSSTPAYSEEVKPSQFSYIETVPKGSTYGYLEPEPDIGFQSSDLRQRYIDRFESDKFSPDKYSTSKSSLDDVYKPSVRDQYKSGLSGQFKSGFGGGDHYKSGFGSSSHYKPGLGASTQYKPSGGGLAESYTGTWEPNINRYLNTGTQKKVTASKGYNLFSWFKNFIAALLLLAILFLIIYIYHQWSTTDPYKTIEDDAERKLLELSEGSGDF